MLQVNFDVVPSALTVRFLSQLKPMNVEYLMMDASILLPPTGTPLTGIDFVKRLPCGDVERTRKVTFPGLGGGALIVGVGGEGRRGHRRSAHCRAAKHLHFQSSCAGQKGPWLCRRDPVEDEASAALVARTSVPCCSSCDGGQRQCSL